MAEKLSREQSKLLHLMADKIGFHGPSSTGFSIMTFKALEKRGYLRRVGNRSFGNTDAGKDIVKRLPKYE